ncbi:FAD-binding domain-containing protein [Cyanobacterium sp. uoEpiScrs1]|uniref:FAD-binding domain-containing protein n=1 Tax=Cyanobacterium sp. uoEpiScrs1 TaxID=2976343 RepID=UPI00226A5CEE|nr:FAD-binding domain-containing protein [Cyanobacterium sp. uoEpiScrs1]
MTNLIIFWHRKDLRINDNIGLSKACQQSHKVVGLFCFDTNILELDYIASVRITYMIGCLKELQQNYRKLGGDLLFIQGTPSQAIPNLAESLQAKSVFWNWDVEPYGRKRDKQVIEALKEKGIKSQIYWDQLLHSPEEITNNSGYPYKVYTPFFKKLLQQKKSSIPNSLNKLEGLTEIELEQAKKMGTIELPSAIELGFYWTNRLVISPGEIAAKERLEYFCDSLIDSYQEVRNFPAIEGTSQLSAALKFGAIGIRTVWQATVSVYENSRSDEMRKSIETWQKELAWREFYQHCLYFFPELTERPYRKKFNVFPWDNNEDDFQSWCEGKTGYPIVDAAMRQLNETGWMHNRCRMIVASFLTKDLIINWQWGEKYFMQKLIDGDLASNNGGWQWSASSGMDPRPLRIFNPASQAQKYDPDGEYIRQWLPELSFLDTECLITGKISPLDCYSSGYPQPIKNHEERQREFKRRYNNIKDL